MKLMTATELYDSKPVPVEWIVEPWLAAEAITELDGKAKSAGKTTLALAMCKAILTGGQFLGYTAQKSAIIYLTEESKTTFLAALRRAGIERDDNFHILFWRETLALRDNEKTSRPSWDEVVDKAINEAHLHGARVLFVDTFAQFAGMIGERENVAGDMLAAIMPLQRARDAGLGVGLVRHERKEGGAVGESGRGNSALTGAVDIVLRLRRAEGQGSDSRRILEALSRFEETPQEITLEWNEEGYEIVGQNGERGTDITAHKLLLSLPTFEGEAMTVQQLMSKGFKRTSLQKALVQLADTGQIQTIGTGKRNDPLRYFIFLPELEGRPL